MLSEKDYNEIIKTKRNAEYMAMLDKSFQELEEGSVVVKTMEELEAMTNG
jgi:antitoxin YefM